MRWRDRVMWAAPIGSLFLAIAVGLFGRARTVEMPVEAHNPPARVLSPEEVARTHEIIERQQRWREATGRSGGCRHERCRHRKQKRLIDP